MSGRRKKVTEITKVERIALVDAPATTKSLAESKDAGVRLEEEERPMDLNELKSKHADLVEAIRKEAAEKAVEGVKASAEQKALVEERDKLKEKVVTLETEKTAGEHKAIVATLLKDSKLPEKAKTDDLRKLLEGAKDEADAKEKLLAIEDSVAKVTGNPVSEERKDGKGGEKVEVKETVAAVKGS